MFGAVKASSLRTLATVVFVVGGFVGLIVWGELASWKAQVARLEANLTQTAKALVQHADDTIDMAKFPLASLITQMEQDRGSADLPARIAQVMRKQVDTTPWLETLSVVDADGRMVATSSTAPTESVNFADRPYFQFHKSSITRQPIVGIPFKSRLSGQWILPVTQRVNDPEGSFAGVVLAAIPVADFEKFAEGFRRGSQGSFMLVREDGIVLARQPFLESLLTSDVSGYDLFKVHLAQSSEGAYHYVSPIDGTRRIGGFYRSGHSGFVGLAAASHTNRH